MHPKTLEALEEIDAALLSGDEFENPESLALFRSYLASWTRVTQSMVATFRATLTTDVDNTFYSVDASYTCRREHDGSGFRNAAEMTKVHSCSVWTFDAQGNKIDARVPPHLSRPLSETSCATWTFEIPPAIKDTLCALAWGSWIRQEKENAPYTQDPADVHDEIERLRLASVDMSRAAQDRKADIDATAKTDKKGRR